MADASSVTTAGIWGAVGMMVMGVITYITKRSDASDKDHHREVEGLNAQLAALQSDNKSLHTKIDQLVGELRVHASTVAKLEAQVEHLKGFNTDLLDRDDKRQRLLTTYEIQNAHLLEENTNLKIEVGRLGAENTLLRGQIAPETPLPPAHP